LNETENYFATAFAAFFIIRDFRREAAFRWMIPRSAVLSMKLTAFLTETSIVDASPEAMATFAFFTNVFRADLAATFRAWFDRDFLTSLITDLILGKEQNLS